MPKVTVDGVEYVPVEEVIDIPPPGELEKPFNSAAFFNYIRPNLFWGSLNQSQVDGINHIGEWLRRAPFTEGAEIEQAAYCLATFQWETASTMMPIAEYGGKSARYAPWYGRGYVQLTWEENYEKQQKKLADMEMVKDADIPYRVHDHRELALESDTSAIISVWGMIDGDFTGKGLDDYINSGKVDYVNARRIVNGTDKQHEIAAMAEHYEEALRLGFA